MYRSDGAPGATDFCTPLPPEIDFLTAEGIAPVLLEQAAARASKQGVTAESLLLAEGLIDENVYYRALARRLGCPFIEGAVALAPGFDYRAALRANVARADPRSEKFDWLFSPRGAEIGALLALAGGAGPNARIALCPPRIFSALVRAKGRHAYADDASLALLRADERLSARAPQLRRSGLFALVFAAALLIGVGALPLGRLDLASLALSAIFLGGILVRLCAMAASCLTRPTPPPPLPERALPTYTIIVPMYREAGMAGQLLAAMRALDYPAAKLEIKFVLEADDLASAGALRLAGLAPNMEIVIAPEGAPRTKPRALNIALPLARGSLLAIFDAEDQPDPQQLRKAAAAFAQAAPNLACFQARLVIDNGGEGWRQRFFALSYATLFDVINPGLAELGLPIPLGGTSNHFRTALLRRVSGWDAWNVTEDADLGLRLARFGLGVGVIDSVTYEDAPTTFAAWLGQRSRWMKGWMQTLAVFLRIPRQNLAKMGLLKALGVSVYMASLILGPLFGPLFMLCLMRDLCFGDLLAPQTTERLLLHTLSLTVALFGGLALVLPNLLGARRRGFNWRSPQWALFPLYLLLISLATWRALWEWARHPFVWNKTEHFPRQAAGEASSDLRNLPAKASAIKARVLSMP